MKRFFAILIFVCVLAAQLRASDSNIAATVYFTNSVGTTNGQKVGIFVNNATPYVYTWTNLGTVSGFYLAATNTPQRSATNFYQTMTNQLSSRLTITYAASNAVTLKSFLNQSLNITNSTGWATNLFTTNIFDLNNNNNTTIAASNGNFQTLTLAGVVYPPFTGAGAATNVFVRSGNGVRSQTNVNGSDYSVMLAAGDGGMLTNLNGGAVTSAVPYNIRTNINADADVRGEVGYLALRIFQSDGQGIYAPYYQGNGSLLTNISGTSITNLGTMGYTNAATFIPYLKTLFPLTTGNLTNWSAISTNQYVRTNDTRTAILSAQTIQTNGGVAGMFLAISNNVPVWSNAPSATAQLWGTNATTGAITNQGTYVQLVTNEDGNGKSGTNWGTLSSTNLTIQNISGQSNINIVVLAALATNSAAVGVTITGGKGWGTNTGTGGGISISGGAGNMGNGGSVTITGGTGNEVNNSGVTNVSGGDVTITAGKQLNFINALGHNGNIFLRPGVNDDSVPAGTNTIGYRSGGLSTFNYFMGVNTFDTNAFFIYDIKVSNTNYSNYGMVSNNLAIGTNNPYGNALYVAGGMTVTGRETNSTAILSTAITNSGNVQSATLNTTGNASVAGTEVVTGNITNSALTANTVIVTDANKALASATLAGGLTISGTTLTAAGVTNNANLSNNLALTFTAFPTNTGSDAQVLSLTGNKTKWITSAGGGDVTQSGQNNFSGSNYYSGISHFTNVIVIGSNAMSQLSAVTLARGECMPWSSNGVMFFICRSVNNTLSTNALGGGAGGSQTPWTANINSAGFTQYNGKEIQLTNASPDITGSYTTNIISVGFNGSAPESLFRFEEHNQETGSRGLSKILIKAPTPGDSASCAVTYGQLADGTVAAHFSTIRGDGSAVTNTEPKGAIMFFGGNFATNFNATGLGTNPVTRTLGWAICNGQNGTPNLTNQFIMGAGGTAQLGVTGGAATHTHDGTTFSVPPTYLHEAEAFAIDSLEISSDHVHDFTTDSASSLPPYYALYYIMKL